jgi:hypothetical protein
MNFTLTQDDYEALIALARKSTQSVDSNGNMVVDQLQSQALESFLKDLETRNGVTRSALWVQWQELDTPIATTARFPYRWPVDLRAYMELLTRPIGRKDVEQLVASRATNPTNIMVTRDPSGAVGWTLLDDFFK